MCQHIEHGNRYIPLLVSSFVLPTLPGQAFAETIVIWRYYWRRP